MSTNQPEDNEVATKEKNIVVSIILTESTASLLELDLPHLEDLTSQSNQSSVCAIIRNNLCPKEENLEAGHSETLNFKEMSAETFYFTSVGQFHESDVSLEQENGISHNNP